LNTHTILLLAQQDKKLLTAPAVQASPLFAVAFVAEVLTEEFALLFVHVRVVEVAKKQDSAMLLVEVIDAAVVVGEDEHSPAPNS